MPLGTKATAQILLGADLSTLFPYDVMNEDNLPVQTAHARLNKSWITGKYLTVGHNGATAQANITQLDKHLDEEQNDSSSDDENNEDLQGRNSPTEDSLPSE